MCAIAGILNLPYDEKVIQKMLASMARRGPDGNGVAMTAGSCLLHTRLAIIDPEGGKQPMQLIWHGKAYTLIYNGELYNTEELRKELLQEGHAFEGYSDTEVLLHAYAQWEESCLERLNGIYAFAVLERKTGKLFLARDRMGVKPLFYTEHSGGLLFASEIKTLLQYPGVQAALDDDGIAQLLLLGPGRKPGSGVLRGIYELEPGCCASYDYGKLSVRRYWQLSDREHREAFEETAETVRWLVKDAISRQMVSDMPIGTFLSGGLDSSLISALCSERNRDKGQCLKTFSLDFQNNDKYFVPGKFQPDSDNQYISLMQNYLRTDHRWTVLSPEDLLENLENATIARDLPGMADVDFSLLGFCGVIRQDVKVALSGECADEIFGGYPWYRDPEIRAAAGFPWAQNTKLRAAYLHPDLPVNAEEYVRSVYDMTISQCDILPDNSQQERQIKQMVNLNYRWFMQTLLDRKDRMSMFHSLEVRVPFCDHRIAEYLYGVPWEYKNYMGVEKGLLRYAMEGYLPKEILWRKKSPYPKTYDPRYMTLVSTHMEMLLSQKDAPIWQIVLPSQVRTLLQGEDPWPWYGQLMKTPQTVAYLLQLNFWLKHHKVTVI